MRRRLTVGLALLRVTGMAALVLLLWNPVTARLDPGDAPPLVLLDASLSMSGHGGRWREALDSARALAKGGGGGGGVIWRFGSTVRAYDTLPPGDGATRLAPALAAAAGRGGPLSVVTDGAIDDIADVPPDLLRRARVVQLPRSAFFDAYVAAVDGPRRVAAGDTLRLKVSYGTAGKAAGDNAGARGRGKGTLALYLAGRRLVSRVVALPDSGTVSTEITLPLSPSLGSSRAGWQALEVRLEGVAGDSEPRDDARVFVLEVSPPPSVVLLASPPDWDSRFLARTLSDVAGVPVRAFVESEPAGGERGWRDAASLAPVSSADVARAVAGARLVVRVGDPVRFVRFSGPGAVLTWRTAHGHEGDWYVQLPGPSPLAGALAGIAWDSLAPAAAVSDLALPLPADSAAVVVLTARLARRGTPRPVIVLSEHDGAGGSARRATVAAAGLFRWAFRGGASAEAYRAVVAALADWLLAGGEASWERFVPVTHEVANGMPVAWRWAGAGSPRDVTVTLTAAGTSRTDTLRFDATGHAELSLPPGVYSYGSPSGAERGVVAVETYSDEWRPAAPVLRAQAGGAAGRLASAPLRERWWLFVVAIAAFATEWAWRRRQGLP
ncbi:MAG: hypothetical protein AUH78_19925 [Gemmatimonadetes bacterium 13_1_40CM_4_69_8]|nr:MAG: hypothetical protein AUH78_19925 [Gemmatimonadetes bacterium 13_1_40CM_4_69_8]